MVAACPQLERLSVAHCQGLTEDWLSELKHCPRLRDLDLSHTPVGSKELAAAVAACPQLERLVVTCQGLKGGWLSELRHCLRLRDLNLSMSYTEIRSEEVAVLVAACPQLERLTVTYGCRTEMSAGLDT